MDNIQNRTRTHGNRTKKRTEGKKKNEKKNWCLVKTKKTEKIKKDV